MKAKYQLKYSKLIKYGYPLIENISKNERKPNKDQILIASTWGDNSITNIVAIELIQTLLREKKYSYNTNSSNIWDPIFNNFQKNLKSTLNSKDNKKIENILDNPGNTNLFIGFENNVSEKDWTNKIEHMYALDKLISFAEFLGIKDIYNPEQDNISVKKIDI